MSSEKQVLSGLQSDSEMEHRGEQNMRAASEHFSSLRLSFSVTTRDDCGRKNVAHTKERRGRERRRDGVAENMPKETLQHVRGGPRGETVGPSTSEERG